MESVEWFCHRATGNFNKNMSIINDNNNYDDDDDDETALWKFTQIIFAQVRERSKMFDGVNYDLWESSPESKKVWRHILLLFTLTGKCCVDNN